jgi:ABC-2 type transport system permease protein
MNAIWLIGKQSIQFLLKDRTGFIWFLLVPVVYILVFGSAFQDSGTDPASVKSYLAVVNNDRGIFSERLLSYLRSENVTVDSIDHKPKELPDRMLTIPDSFSASLAEGVPVKIDFTSRAAANSQSTMTARIAVQKAYYRLLADMAELKLKGRISRAGFEKLDQNRPLLTVKTEYAGKHETIPRGYSQQVPAQIVQFSTLRLFIYAGSAMLDEKRRGLLQRIKTAPVHFLQLFLGKLLYILLLGFFQSILLLGIGRFVFGIYLGSSLPALLLTLIVFVLAIGSIGLCLGFIIRNPEKMLGIAILLGLALSAISGCWWPIEITPDWMQKLALTLPTGMALKALHMIISFGKGFKDILPFILGLMGISAFFSALLARFLIRFES